VVVCDLFICMCAGVVEEVSIVFVVYVCVVYIYIGHHHIYILPL
jgi:hypothetical protein